MTDASEGVPVVAIVGRPNVGKSSLVNRILGRREAIVEAMPGVTRDRKHFVAEWNGRAFEIVDTGGLEPGVDGLDARVAEQAQVAIEAADAIVLVVDASVGPTQDDLTVADTLRKSDKPVVVAANKVDDPADEPLAAAFFRLGLGEPRALSALHGRGSGDFLQALVQSLPEVRRDADDSWGSVAIIGRPNVGKSSILNALTGEERAIVDSIPGTTRDPVDARIALDDGRVLRIVDTAGMRRQTQIKDPLEYFSFLRSRRTLTRVDVALLVIDAGEGVTSHDQHLANEIVEHGRACVVALNKWDLIPPEDTDRKRLETTTAEKLRFVPWATFVRTGALTGRGIDKLGPKLVEATESHRRRLPTALVNRLVRDAQQQRPHPRVGGRASRILYAVQAESAPPTVVVFSTGRVEENYRRYLENRLRESEPFAGSPLRIEVRVKARRERYS
ncbi:MAG: ribosome biogenesis GTPase Der [Actinomycetota bacterium]|nr:ribosome biogenesis GTPase Der [Actinomycetota bacterium]